MIGIRKLLRLTWTSLAVWAIAIGFNRLAEGQYWLPGSAPTCNISAGTTALASLGVTTFSINNWSDTDIWVDGESQSNQADGMGWVDWSVISGPGMIVSFGSSSSNAVLIAKRPATDSTVIVQAIVHDSGTHTGAVESVTTTASVTVKAPNPYISLEINQPGSQDNYLALGGTGSLTVCVEEGADDTNYTVALSCAGSGSPSGSVAFSSTSVTVASGNVQALSLSGAAPGYFAITGTASNAAPGTVNGAVVQVDIKRSIGGGAPTPITGGTTRVMVGEHIVLAGVTQPGVSGSSLWTVPGTLVKSYSQSTARTVTESLSDSDLSGGTIGYYWIAGGAGQVVTYSTSVGSVSLSASTTFDVLCPTATLNCELTKNRPAVACVYPGFPGSGFQMCCGTSGVGAYGISWSGTVTTPEDGLGSLELVQLVNTNNQETTWPRGTVRTLSSSGDYVLDNPIPYGQQTVIIASNDTRTISDNDTPGDPLAGLSQMSTDDDFHLYLMYRPYGDDSIWVALSEVHWGWSGSCSWTILRGWDLGKGSSFFEQGGPLDSKLPAWTNYYTNLKWKNN